MYVRKTKSRNSTCFQVGNKVRGKFALVVHIGCTSIPEQVETLRRKAEYECERLRLEFQPSLFPISAPDLKAKLSNWHITGFHQMFGHVYNAIGFPNGMLRDLVIARIVYPKSKAATARYFAQYLNIKLSEDQIYRFLDTLNKSDLTRIAYDFISKKNNGIALIFYDVTTLYFEANNEDELRKKGYSKDHKNDLPQILIGLFVDRDGYPFDFDFYEGSTFEGHTFSKAVKALTAKYKFENLVVVADAGMLSENNISFLEKEGLSYIVGARFKSLSEKFKKPIFAHDFTDKPTFETSLEIKLETGETREKRLVIDFSDKRARKDQFNREKLIKNLEAKIATKKDLIKKSKYLILENQGKIAGIDHEKVELDKRHDGLKGYWTNLDKKVKPKEIIAQYHNLWKVEKAFRMSKSDLQERPIFHHKLERIRGHLLICFCALLVMKETERILAPIDVSLLKAIEILGKIGQGEMTLGRIKMPIESELDSKAQSILDQVLGH